MRHFSLSNFNFRYVFLAPRAMPEGLFRGCFGDVSGMFWGCFGDVSGMFRGCFADVVGSSAKPKTK